MSSQASAAFHQPIFQNTVTSQHKSSVYPLRIIEINPGILDSLLSSRHHVLHSTHRKIVAKANPPSTALSYIRRCICHNHHTWPLRKGCFFPTFTAPARYHGWCSQVFLITGSRHAGIAVQRQLCTESYGRAILWLGRSTTINRRK